MIELSDIVVVSLAIDHGRRRHIEQHFREAGFSGHRYVEAVAADSPAVKAAYRAGRVAGYPACFRCGKDRCGCVNNILIPPQVANWLSFQAIWESLPTDRDAYVLICEDDVAFHTGARAMLDRFMAGFTPVRDQILIRLANSGEAPFRNLADRPLRTHDAPVMSNAAYILNGALAARLAQEKPQIATTSDIWLHRQIAAQPDVQAITLDPLLATDLSFNRDFALFPSRIHPKGIDPEDIRRKEQHVMRADSAEAYASLRPQWLGQDRS